MRAVVHLIGCGSRPTADLPDFAADLREAQWDPWIVPTAVGRRFIDTARAEARTGHPVLWEFDPDAPEELAPAQVTVVAPATFNTLAKLAAGISDTLGLALVNEAIGAGRPVVVVPWTNSDLARHPVYAQAVTLLDEWGVRLVPGDQSAGFPWTALRAAMEQVRAGLRR